MIHTLQTSARLVAFLVVAVLLLVGLAAPALLLEIVARGGLLGIGIATTLALRPGESHAS